MSVWIRVLQRYRGTIMVMLPKSLMSGAKWRDVKKVKISDDWGDRIVIERDFDGGEEKTKVD